IYFLNLLIPFSASIVPLKPRYTLFTYTTLFRSNPQFIADGDVCTLLIFIVLFLIQDIQLYINAQNLFLVYIYKKLIMKVYTKTGDKGTTALFGGTRVPKYHIRIESYGTVDELNSYIGLIRDQKINELYQNQLIRIQDKLFTVGAILATDPEKAV